MIKVRIFPSLWSKRPKELAPEQKFVDLEDAWEIIRSDQLKEYVEPIRAEPDKAKRKKMKEQTLPIIQFQYNEQGLPNPLMVIDWEADFHMLEAVQESVVMKYASPSGGTAMAVVIRLPDQAAESWPDYERLSKATEAMLNISTSQHQQSYDRCRFFSYDPDAFYNPEALPFFLTPQEEGPWVPPIELHYPQALKYYTHLRLNGSSPQEAVDILKGADRSKSGTINTDHGLTSYAAKWEKGLTLLQSISFAPEDPDPKPQLRTPFPFHLFPKAMQSMSSSQVMALVVRTAHALNMAGVYSILPGWAPQAFNLFVLIYGESTENKTANAKAAFFDLISADINNHDHWKEEKKRIIAENKKAKKNEQQEMPEMPPSNITDNFTVESVYQALERAPLILAPGEVGTLFQSKNYTNDGGSSLDANLCDFWNGETFNSMRVDRRIFIPRVRVSLFTTGVLEDLAPVFGVRRNGGLFYRTLLIRSYGEPSGIQEVKQIADAIRNQMMREIWKLTDGQRVHPSRIVKVGGAYAFRKLDQYQQRLTPIFNILFSACGEPIPMESSEAALTFMLWYEADFENILEDMNGITQLKKEGLLNLRAEQASLDMKGIMKAIEAKEGKPLSKSAFYRKLQAYLDKGIIVKTSYGKYSLK